MKLGPEHAKKLKRLHGTMLRKFGKPEEFETLEPIEQLIIGILASCTTHAKAVHAYRKLRSQTVDLNELRVTPAVELAEQIGDMVPLAAQKAQRIVDALNGIRKRHDSLDISFLKQRGRREAREYLESLEGVDRAAAASVVLYSLGGHAIPLDDLMIYVLQKEGVIEPNMDPAEIQRFVEHHIPAAQAKEFSDLLARYATAHAPRIPLERLGELLRPPPPPPAEPAVKPESNGAARKSRTAERTAASGKTAGSKSTAAAGKSASAAAKTGSGKAAAKSAASSGKGNHAAKSAAPAAERAKKTSLRKKK